MFLDRLVQFWYGNGKENVVKTYFPFVRDWLKVNGIKTDRDGIREDIKFRKRRNAENQKLRSQNDRITELERQLEKMWHI